MFGTRWYSVRADHKKAVNDSVLIFQLLLLFL